MKVTGYNVYVMDLFEYFPLDPTRVALKKSGIIPFRSPHLPLDRAIAI